MEDSWQNVNSLISGVQSREQSELKQYLLSIKAGKIISFNGNSASLNPFPYYENQSRSNNFLLPHSFSRHKLSNRHWNLLRKQITKFEVKWFEKKRVLPGQSNYPQIFFSISGFKIPLGIADDGGKWKLARFAKANFQFTEISLTFPAQFVFNNNRTFCSKMCAKIFS